MAKYQQVKCVRAQVSDNANRITVTWVGPDGVTRTYAVNQRTLNGFSTEADAKGALDTWTQKNFGYVLNDVFLHKNRDGSWAIATGQEPAVWPEDEEVVSSGQ